MKEAAVTRGLRQIGTSGSKSGVKVGVEVGHDQGDARCGFVETGTGEVVNERRERMLSWRWRYGIERRCSPDAGADLARRGPVGRRFLK